MRKEVKKYRTVKKWLFNILNIGYIIGIITCFICNLVIDHKLTWFLIVLVGILISFSITGIPFYLKGNKYKALKITSIVTVLVYLLLFVINYLNVGNWLLDSYLIATFVFMFLWVDVLICTFTGIAANCKIAISLILLSFVTVFTNFVCAKVLNITNSHSNIPNIICAVIMVAISFAMIIKQSMNKK
ncbi:MAG: hypothetical protein HFJ12_06870 [Bacilli bacterium]|nr:hypothetical protein [Bacilli bacterium]